MRENRIRTIWQSGGAVVNGARPQWFMLLLGLIVVAAAIGDRSLRDWALRGR